MTDLIRDEVGAVPANEPKPDGLFGEELHRAIEEEHRRRVHPDGSDCPDGCGGV